MFFLLVEHPSNEDPLADGKEMVAATISRTLGDALRDLGVDAAGAEPWAHGLVGLGLSTGEWWLRRRTMSRAAVSRYLSSFVWNAFEGIARENGVRIDSQGRLRLVTAGRNAMSASTSPASSTTGRPASARPRSRCACAGTSSRSTAASTGGAGSRADPALETHTSGSTVTLVTPHGEAAGPALRRGPLGPVPDQRDGPPALLRPSGPPARHMHRFPM